MEFRKFDLEGPLEIIPRKIEDERGYFSEVFRLSTFAERAAPTTFVQDNQSLSIRAGTIRGIHFQSHPEAQGKLVRCLSGRLVDVAVDLRHESPTFGKYVSVVLSPEETNQLWIPVGFGHAFCTLEPDSVISYRVTSYYSPEHDKGVAWNDPDIAIDWPAIADPTTLSAKDRKQPSLAELPAYFAVKGA
ncbi:MAG: dTDP-4-dehydrorhamnose 3,5-epimerase [Pseudomonadota bacterium]|nr:dTDP-4-dehydrorhamnose 3,5-epimerase [Pseudomonadota bacterium]